MGPIMSRDASLLDNQCEIFQPGAPCAEAPNWNFWEAPASQHKRGSLDAPLMTSAQYCCDIWGLTRGPSIGLTWCWETSVSRTAVLLNLRLNTKEKFFHRLRRIRLPFSIACDGYDSLQRLRWVRLPFSIAYNGCHRVHQRRCRRGNWSARCSKRCQESNGKWSYVIP